MFFINTEKILLVEDEKEIREMIKEYLSIEEFLIDEACDGSEGLNLLKKREYSIVVLDVMMPNIDGWTVCKEIRKESQVPIIMLTARGEEYDKILGFELGVDDYMVKPFSPKELLARIKAIIRRSKGESENLNHKNIYIFEALKIDFNARNVSINEKDIILTPKEYDLLIFFIKNVNRVFSRDQLLNQVWGYDFYGDNRTVDTHVKMLREKLGEYRKLIKTVWGVGYKFEVGGTK